MRERLREVPHQLPRVRVELLREQAERARGACRQIEHLARLALAPLPGVALGQPEAAGEERALLARQAVIAVVAAQESVDGELLANSVGGADHTLVVEGHEAHDREEQQSAVEVRLIEALHERPPLRVISA